MGIAEQYELNESNDNFIINVEKVCKGLSNTAFGYKWMYFDKYEQIKKIK